MPLMIVPAALLGLAIGSFLNVVIHRLPQAVSLTVPASQCPACSHPIRPSHNVPVLSWVLLRGRCADCGSRISIRYPAVELVTAALFVGLTIRLGHLDRLTALPGYLYFAAIGVALTMIDLDVRRLPDAIVLPAYPVLAVLLTTDAIVHGDPVPLVRAAVGAAALFAGYLALAVSYPAGMGLGDVKLAGVVGGVLGYLSYQALMVGAIAAFLLGAVAGLLVIAGRRGTRKSAVPFGPFMIAGALLAVFAGVPIADVYSQLVLRA